MASLLLPLPLRAHVEVAGERARNFVMCELSMSYSTFICLHSRRYCIYRRVNL